MVRALFVSVCLMMMVGCGGSSGRPATVDCEDYVENFLCPAVTSCTQYSTYASFGDCVSYFENVVYGCSTALEAPGLYTCESDTNSYSCGALFDANYTVTPPFSCSGIFY
jgi:hypothetical protein